MERINLSGIWRGASTDDRTRLFTDEVALIQNGGRLTGLMNYRLLSPPGKLIATHVLKGTVGEKVVIRVPVPNRGSLIHEGYASPDGKRLSGVWYQSGRPNVGGGFDWIRDVDAPENEEQTTDVEISKGRDLALTS